MPHDDRHLWLGHLIIAPSMRGGGWGTRMTRRFFQVGFGHPQTEEISLVVFPENLGAIRCYRRAGMEEWGEQHKTFDTSGRRYRMIHMGIKRQRFEAMQASPNGAPAQ